MPIYEFRCQNCRAKSELLLNVAEADFPGPCPHCQGTLQRLISRFRRGRAENDRIDEIADQIESMAEPESATQMREFIKEMGRASDDDMSEELEEMFEADLEPESPE